MKAKELLALLLLAALWGASFLFIRIAAPGFGAMNLAFVRVTVASVCLLPLLVIRQAIPLLWRSWWPLLWVGLLNSALPFSMFGYASLSLSAGFSAMLNATTPMWGAIVAYCWLKTPLARTRILGLLIGFAGVGVLVWGKVSFKQGGDGLAVLAVMVATLSYGIAANIAKQYLAEVPAFVVAGGSQLMASVLLLPLALVYWPVKPIAGVQWASACALGVACTAVAYVLYFWLIAKVGASKAISVTFLIPLFAMAWGAMVLGEQITSNMVLGGGVILVGTSLAIALWQPQWWIFKQAA